MSYVLGGVLGIPLGGCIAVLGGILWAASWIAERFHALSYATTNCDLDTPGADLHRRRRSGVGWARHVLPRSNREQGQRQQEMRNSRDCLRHGVVKLSRQRLNGFGPRFPPNFANE